MRAISGPLSCRCSQPSRRMMTISTVIKSKLLLKKLKLCSCRTAASLYIWRYIEFVGVPSTLKYALPEVDRAWPAMSRLHIAARAIFGTPGIFK